MARYDEEHLRRFVAARRRGAHDEMRRCWEQVVTDFFDRIDGFVATAHRGRLSGEEHELAVELCLIRFSQRLIDTFEGVSVGELVLACRTMAERICIDVQRRSVRERKLAGPSLDDSERADPAWEAESAKRRHADAEASWETREFIAWALPQLKEDRRRVLELTFLGAAVPEIMEELGIGRDNAYQLRARGLSDLRRLKEQYDR